MDNTIQVKGIQWTRIKHDANGNSRHVCGFMFLLTDNEKNAPIWDKDGRRIYPSKYDIACKRANKLGGRKYDTKGYGGGIVFQAMECELKTLTDLIFGLIAKES